MPLVFSEAVLEKLKDKHGVSKKEVEDCIANRVSGVLKDTREKHKTNPPTLWFIAETNQKRLLKVAFVNRSGEIHIKTAYEPNEDEIRIYKEKA